MPVDFDAVRNKHSQWRVRLNKFLRGEEDLTLAGAGTHRDCDLGKWIHGEGRARFGHLPEMLELAKIHRDMHDAVIRTIQSQEAGQTQQAQQALQAVQELSRKVILQINLVESRISQFVAT